MKRDIFTCEGRGSDSHTHAIDTRKSAHRGRYVFTFANYRQLFAYVIMIDLSLRLMTAAEWNRKDGDS